MRRALLPLALLVFSPMVFAVDAFVARVEIDAEGKELKRLDELGVDVDHCDEPFFDQLRGWVRVYLKKGQIDKLRANGFVVTPIYNDAPRQAELALEASAQRVEAQRGSIPAQYHTYATLTADMQQIATDHPDIVRLVSIGQSVQGRELWMMKISKNPDLEEDEPEFAYISSMHGDEVVGKEMLYHLIDYMTDNYGSDSRVTTLVDTTEIWIMPSMNPDGTELGQRWNANGADLNRDFPDQFIDPVNTTAGREKETAHVMNWRAGLTIDLSSNFHGGAVVANYPFDSNPAGTSTFSPVPSPDDATFLSLAQTYADANVPMSQQNGGSFVNGTTNGADWFSINGGMQDWNYVWYGGFEVLMELSQQKWPPASTLPGFWDDNLEAMLLYMERVHEGIRGVVTDIDTGLPIAAQIQVDANPFPDYTDPQVGDYHRLLMPGSYTVTISADGYETLVFPNVVVNAGPATVVDAQLGPAPVNLQVKEASVLDGDDGVIELAEVADLAVTLENLGRGASGITARLITTGYDATVTREMVTYPDIALGGEALPDSLNHEIAANATIPDGRKLGFAVVWESNEGNGSSEPFFLEVGSATTDLSSSVDVPVTIPTFANVTATSTLNIGAANAISNITAIRVVVDITHSYIGDIEMTLEAPDGTTVVLHDNTGGSAQDIVGTYGVDLTPAQSLDAFLGGSSLGTWTLTVVDSVLQDGGAIDGWSLDIEGRPEETTTPELKLRDVVYEGSGKIRLSWWEYPGLTSYRVYRSTDPSSAAAFVDVTGLDPNTSDTIFDDTTVNPIDFYLVTGVGPNGEGPKGHFGE